MRRYGDDPDKAEEIEFGGEYGVSIEFDKDLEGENDRLKTHTISCDGELVGLKFGEFAKVRG